MCCIYRISRISHLLYCLRAQFCQHSVFVGSERFSNNRGFCKLDPVYSATALLILYKFLGLLFDPDDGGNMFLRNVDELLPDYIELHVRTQYILQTQCILGEVNATPPLLLQTVNKITFRGSQRLCICCCLSHVPL